MSQRISHQIQRELITKSVERRHLFGVYHDVSEMDIVILEVLKNSLRCGCQSVYSNSLRWC